jgi:hypothetical protein
LFVTFYFLRLPRFEPASFVSFLKISFSSGNKRTAHWDRQIWVRGVACDRRKAIVFGLLVAKPTSSVQQTAVITKYIKPSGQTDLGKKRCLRPKA